MSLCVFPPQLYALYQGAYPNSLSWAAWFSAHELSECRDVSCLPSFVVPQNLHNGWHTVWSHESRPLCTRSLVGNIVFWCSLNFMPYVLWLSYLSHWTQLLSPEVLLFLRRPTVAIVSPSFIFYSWALAPGNLLGTVWAIGISFGPERVPSRSR